MQSLPRAQSVPRDQPVPRGRSLPRGRSIEFVPGAQPIINVQATYKPRGRPEKRKDRNQKGKIDGPTTLSLLQQVAASKEVSRLVPNSPLPVANAQENIEKEKPVLVKGQEILEKENQHIEKENQPIEKESIEKKSIEKKSIVNESVEYKSKEGKLNKIIFYFKLNNY